jgi:WD40 repeat protein
VTASADGTAPLRTANSGTQLCRTDTHSGFIVYVAFGRIIATASGDPSNSTDLSRNAVILWDAESRLSIAELRAHTPPIWSVTFSADGSLLSTASQDQRVRVWDVSLVTGRSGTKLLEEFCRGELTGAQTFLAEKFRQSVLAERRHI